MTGGQQPSDMSVLAETRTRADEDYELAHIEPDPPAKQSPEPAAACQARPRGGIAAQLKASGPRTTATAGTKQCGGPAICIHIVEERQQHSTPASVFEDPWLVSRAAVPCRW
jgi:hypothetical protein